MSTGYVPDRGDIVWVNFTPHSGSEQAGHRPALVISDRTFNRRGFFGVMPITTKVKGNPFEVPVPDGGQTTGVVLVNQFKILDWRTRGVSFREAAGPEVVADCVGLLLAIIDPAGEFSAFGDDAG